MEKTLASSPPPLLPHKLTEVMLRTTTFNVRIPIFAPKSPQNPRLRPLRSPSRRSQPPRLLCRAKHSEGAVPTALSPAMEEPAAEVESLAVGNPTVPASLGMCRMSLGDQAFFLLVFIATTASMAFTGLAIAAVPTLFAMRRAAISFAKLADTAREELPSTMSAVRLSGMEISDLTLELNDLSKEIADGVTKSAQVVQAAEAGIRQIGSIAHDRTMTMIQERASLPDISVKLVVVGAAKKTSQAVGQATKNIINFISRGERGPEDEEEVSDRGGDLE